MAKIKFSKTELKHQRDQLKQFTRYLPTLQLKKQQLQMEVMRMNEEINAHQQRILAFSQEIEAWVALFQTSEAELVEAQVVVEKVILDTRNIAGVDIPVFTDVQFAPCDYSLFSTSPWVDEGVRILQERIRLQVQGGVLERQRKLLEDELRTTSQRVNLFEKVKIPECRESIRVIRIYLGDQQTAAVGRAKIAKNRLVKSA